LKRAEEVMEILEAYDLAGTLRGAAVLAGCDHKTVAHWVRQRELAGGMVVAERRRPAVGDFAGKIDELVERSHGRIRADVAHGKLVALGYEGSSRTTRRWVAESKRRWRREHGRRAEVLCICGPSGTGKSHFVEALGHLAIDQGKTVAWHTLETLSQLLHRHRADDSVNKAVGKLIRSDLIIIDDVGLLPVSTDAAEALFRVVDAAYEKRSIAISSNIHPSGFDELMPKTIATATVDRLLHHAHVLMTDGSDSYRLAQATAGKGVTPLN
jgi:IstB-like ATP binding protein